MEHKFIKNKDIYCSHFSTVESGIGFNFKEMAYELAHDNRSLICKPRCRQKFY